MSLKVAILYFSLIFAESWAQQVNTPDGPIIGTKNSTYSGRTYCSYYLIPFAKPPIGSRRFLATELIDPWTEVHNGTTENVVCCRQMLAHYGHENEDCLYMNVFSPQDPTAPSRNLPVMVFIHGGGFMTGCGVESFVVAMGGNSPKQLLENDVIFVSFNYRLGVFGFLSTGDDVIPGNAGLKDQILALKWIQRNIAAFGGDPKKVTVFGVSAGASSIGYLISSPAANGLFANAIMESGTSLLPCTYQRNHTEISFKTGAFIDSQFNSSRNSQDLLKVMQNASAEDIDNAAASYVVWDSTQPGYMGRLMLQQGLYFTPTVEVPNDNAVLTELQYETIAKGNINKVPILIGTCAEEGLLNLDQGFQSSLEGYDSDSSYLTPQNLHIKDYGIWQQVGGLIKNHYTPNSSFTDYPLGAIRFFTEQNFVKPVTKHAELQSSFTDVFVYEFAYTGTMGGNTRSKFPGSLNVTHTEEWGYIFRGPTENFPEDDQLIHNRIMRIWTNFAIYKNPTPTQEELLQNITWPKVQPGNFQHIKIGNFNTTDLQIVQGKQKADGMAFWENIYDTYGIRPFDSY